MAEILHRITIDAGPDRVFDALTVSEGLQSWWTQDSTATPEIGSVALFKFVQGTIVFRMRVEDLIPGKKVAWSCLGDLQEWEGTRLTWELESTENGGTDLRFAHSGWNSTEGDYPRCNTTWGHLMHLLKAYAEGKPVKPHFSG
jgi:uncharacterized protein YndB with AHSA1/START domain